MIPVEHFNGFSQLYMPSITPYSPAAKSWEGQKKYAESPYELDRLLFQSPQPDSLSEVKHLLRIERDGFVMHYHKAAALLNGELTTIQPAEGVSFRNAPVVVKIILPGDADEYRTADKRPLMLQGSLQRSPTFSPSVIGMHRVISTGDGNSIGLSARIVSPAEFKSDEQYLLVMWRLTQGEELAYKFGRNRLPELMHAVVCSLVQEKERAMAAEPLNHADILQYASPEALGYKYLWNNQIYEKAIRQMIETDSLNKVRELQKFSDVKEMLELLIHHPIFHTIVMHEIETNNVYATHGDTQLFNGFYSDYRASEPIENPADTIDWIDAIDFERLFSVQSGIANAAMTAVDLLARYPKELFKRFVQDFFDTAEIRHDSWKKAFFLISLFDKAAVRKFNATLWDGNSELAKRFKAIVEYTAFELQKLFVPNIPDDEFQKRVNGLRIFSTEF